MAKWALLYLTLSNVFKELQYESILRIQPNSFAQRLSKPRRKSCEWGRIGSDEQNKITMSKSPHNYAFIHPD
jgi:hypothetical protein